MRIHSPTKGIVKNVSTKKFGDVIKSGDTILEIVPINEDLIAEIKVSPENISKIKIGQHVKLKISAYDTMAYGYLEGVVSNISPSTITNESNSYYPCRVEITPSSLSHIKNQPLLPGMQVSGGFFLGRTTVFKYLLKPIRSAFLESY